MLVEILMPEVCFTTLKNAAESQIKMYMKKYPSSNDLDTIIPQRTC